MSVLTTSVRPTTRSALLRHPLVVWAVPLLVASITCLVGLVVEGMLLFGAIAVVAQQQTFSPDLSRRNTGRATSLIALWAIVGLVTPGFLPTEWDVVALALCSTIPLTWLYLWSRETRQILRVRRLSRLDRLWLQLSITFAVVVGVVTVIADGWDSYRPQWVPLVLLSALLPFFDEAVYRGLLMQALGTRPASVLTVALVQAGVVGSVFGWVAALLTAPLAVAFGFIRRGTGSWQTAFVAHLGFTLGVLVPVFFTAAVTR
jgi:membrane protease YdiL (CAAX protease family)